MDWLRSEDLKEVKVATAPSLSLAVMKGERLTQLDLYTTRALRIMDIWAKRIETQAVAQWGMPWWRGRTTKNVVPFPTSLVTSIRP